jgi:hypothetical protein
LVQPSWSRIVQTRRTMQYPRVAELLLKLRFAELNTLLVIYREGSPRKAAQVLRRDQGAVSQQLVDLNSIFEALCGEPLAKKGARGEDYIFTPTGELETISK